MNFKPFPFQEEGVKIIEEFDGRCLIADSPGLGKSAQALYWAVRNNVFPVVVVCPASVKYHWQREASQWFGLRAEVLSGTRPPKKQSLAGADIIVINYDILGPWLDTLRSREPKLVVSDEVHFIKSPRARRTKYVKALCRDVKHVLGLSGTPMTTSPVNLFPILNLLRPKYFGNFFAFAHAYCDPRMKPWGWDYSGSSNEDELHELLLETVMVRRVKEDVLHDLPKKSRHVFPVPVSNRAEYDRAVADFINWLREKSPAKANRAERAERLVRAGYIKRLAANLKMKSVVEWIDDFLPGGEKLAVFGIQRKLLQWLHKRYKGRSVLVNGDVVGKARQEAVDQFVKDRRVRLFIGNIQASGVGLDGLQRVCSNSIIAEVDWVPGNMIQVEDRIYRIGQHDKTSIWYPVAKDTAEEWIMERLQDRQGTLDHVMDGKKGKTNYKLFDLFCEELLRRNGRG